MAVDFTEKAKRYQAIDEIIASGRKLKWNQIISELGEVYNIKTSRTSFFRDIEESKKQNQFLLRIKQILVPQKKNFRMQTWFMQR